MTSLLELIDEADLIEVDGNSIRYFGLSEDELADAEAGDEDACVLTIEMVDADCNLLEWFFTYKELKEAVRTETGDWIVNYGTAHSWGAEKLLVTIYKLEKL